MHASKSLVFQLVLFLALTILSGRFLLAASLDDSFTKEQLAEANKLNERILELYRQGKFQDAIPLARQVLVIRQRVQGNEHTDTALSLKNLGLLLQNQGDYEGARSCFEQALKIRRRILGDEHLDTARSLNNLGDLRQTQGDYAGARPYFEQALKILRKIPGEELPDKAVLLNNLGLLLQNQDDYAGARSYYEQALKISRKALGEDHRYTSAPLNNLGFLLQNQGDYVGARTYYEQALTISRKVLGEEHPDTVVSIDNLGVLLQLQGDYAGAKSYYEQALKIRKKVLGDDHPDTARSLNNLGHFRQAQGDDAGAREYFEQALKILRKALGEENPDTALLLSNLGSLLQNQDDYPGARVFYEQALKIRKKVLGEEHPATAQSFDNLALLVAGANQWGIAANFEDQARRGIRKHVARVLPALSAQEQLKFLQKTDEGPLHSAMTIGFLRHKDAKTSALSAGWLLNGKCVAQVALAERALLTRDVNDPKLAHTVQELFEVRRKLAGLALAAPQPGKETARREMLEQLAVEEDRLSRQLSAVKGDPARKNSWVELEEVQKALQMQPTQSVLIDIARFNVFDFRAKGKEKKWQPAHYAAWIIPASGTVQVVDLGLADAIDAAIERAKKSLETASAKDSVLQKRGEREAEQEVRKDLQAVADLVWKPLFDKLGNAKRLMLSPDASLWLLPWGALPTGENKFLIEDYAITYLISGRDLVSNQQAKIPTGPAVVVANPDFDLPADQVNAAIKAVFRDKHLVEVDQTRAFSAETALKQVRRLPGTASEAQAIKPSIEQYSHATPQMYTDQYALESIFKKVNRPRIAVLSTHGFFLPDQQVKQEDNLLVADTRSVALTVDGKPIENPLLRCGLLFAGCNSRQTVGGDDGILTGIEIVGIDLRGTEMVVLSACETGVGQVRNGEGVAGLRQAFQLAGAESVVATLWQIPDIESARIMKDFFTNLAQGHNKTDALRAAQLNRIAARRDKYGAAHPYFWAAFTLTGQ